MDKKQSSNRSNQAQSKGFGSEGKKGQDVANKPWPRSGGRRREPSGGSSIKNEPSRKPIPQRNKIALDKRPKPRGAYYSGCNLGGKEDAGITVDSAEIGSVFLQGSKKQSLNHLLNFHYTPRQAMNDGTSNVYRTPNFNRMQYGLKHKYNKEEFLQATCQFVVNSNGNYEVYMKDPDALVNWELIEQINVQGSEFPCCPICLYTPVAAKMTRCGHIYCWSCILHYLALSDKSWRKCPICFEAIHKQDLKSVVAKPYNNVIVIGNKIQMTLMKRERGSLIAAPVEETEYHCLDNILNVSENNVTTAFSKLLLAEENDILMIVDREKNELIVQLSLDENCPEKCFIEQALELLSVREKTILEKCSEVEIKKKSSNYKNHDSEKENSKQMEINIKSDENKDSSGMNIPKNFYFYQASDGQHIYLHSLNIRMLEHLYGSLENCPLRIEGVIVEKENGSITEELRKRMRYLQHLPVTCQFEIAELELESPYVTPEVLDHLKDQIDNRRKRRQKRARDERRHEKRIIEKENRLMGKYPTPYIQIESYHQFPNFVGSFETVEDGSPPLSSTSITTESFTSLNEYLSESMSSDGLSENAANLHLNENLTNVSGPSFANMLSKTKVENVFWPTLKSTAQIQKQQAETSLPPKLISVTGKNCRVGFDIKHQQYGGDSDSTTDQNDDYIPAPQYNKSFSDAIALALEQSANQVCNDEKPVNTEVCVGKKKKKQNRKVLFATGMACTGK